MTGNMRLLVYNNYKAQNFTLLRRSKTHAVAQFCKRPFQCSVGVNEQ